MVSLFVICHVTEKPTFHNFFYSSNYCSSTAHFHKSRIIPWNLTPNTVYASVTCTYTGGLTISVLLTQRRHLDIVFQHQTHIYHSSPIPHAIHQLPTCQAQLQNRKKTVHYLPPAAQQVISFRTQQWFNGYRVKTLGSHPFHCILAMR